MRHITEDLRKDLTSIIQDEFWQQGCDGDSFESLIRQQVDKIANTLECRMNSPKKLRGYGTTRYIWNHRGKWYIADCLTNEEPFCAHHIDTMPEETVDYEWITAHTVSTLWYQDASKLIDGAFRNYCG